MSPPAHPLTRWTARLAALAVCAVTALTGCQGVTGAAGYSRVRLIETSPDTPAVDLYSNGATMLFNVPFGTTSSYIPVAAGTYTYTIETAGLHQQLATATATLAPGAQYTVLVSNTVSALHMSVLKDQAIPAPAGQFALRLLHQATRFGAVDLYLVPAGGELAGASPIATNLIFGNTPVYLSAPAGTYSVLALPAGAAPSASPVPLYTGTQLEYRSGSARTILLIDRSFAAAPGLQLLTADDLD